MKTSLFTSIRFKLLAQISTLLLFIIFVVMFTRVTINNQKSDGKVINVAGRERMLTQKMSKEIFAVTAFAAANVTAYKKNLEGTIKLFENSLHALRNGNDAGTIPAAEDPAVIKQLAKVNQLWDKFKSKITVIQTASVNTDDYNKALEYIGNNNVTLLKEMNRAVGMYEKYASGKIATLTNSLMYILWLAVFLVLFIGYKIHANISVPLTNTCDTITKIADGDYTIRQKVQSNDEIGVLVTAINKLAEDIGNSIEEAKQKGHEATEAAAEANKTKDYLDAEYKYLERSANTMIEAMDKFAEGDLTVFIKPERDSGEIYRLFEGFNRTIIKVKNIILSVSDAVEATASASTQISSSAEEMAAGSQEQSAQTSEVTTAVEEMAKAIMDATKNVTEVADLAKHAGDTAKEGGDVVHQSIDGMEGLTNVVANAADKVEELGESSQKIGEIIQVIDDIADQTNLLALNAAIEAARAGEQGRGFAVVADEVRKLAERTTTATKEIAEMIKQIQTQTEQAVEAMREGKNKTISGKELVLKAGSSLDEIMAGTDQVIEQVQQVAVASEEQSTTVEIISNNIEGINQVAQEASSAVQQIAAAAEDLNRLTENLQGLVQQFKFDSNNGTAGNYRIDENGHINQNNGNLLSN